MASVEDFRSGLKLGDSVYISTGQGPVLARFIEWRGPRYASVRKYLKKRKKWKNGRTRVMKENILRVAPRPITAPTHPADPRPVGTCPHCYGTLVDADMLDKGDGSICLNCDRRVLDPDQVIPLETEG